MILSPTGNLLLAGQFCLILGSGDTVLGESSGDAAGIIAKTVARSQTASANPADGGFTYTRVSVTEEFDGAGKIKQHKKRVYQVSFRDGATCAKLVEVDGHAPGEADLKKQAENETSFHQLLGEGKPAKGDNRESFLTPQVAARFDFAIESEISIAGRQTYVISFQPKNPAPAEHRLADRLLDRLSGRLWIDAAEFEIARAEVQLRSEVDLLGGVIGCLRKLDYKVTRTRLPDGVWLTNFSSGDFEGRKLLDSLHVKTRSQSSNFQPSS